MRILSIRNLFATTLLLLVPLATMAEVEPDELRGRVLDVDVSERTLTLHLIEVGRNVDGQVDSIKTYNIPESVEIRDEFRSEVIQDTLEDIEEDDVVIVELDVDDRTMARGIQYEAK